MHTRHRYLCMQVFVKCRVVHNNLHCKPSKMMLWLPTYGRLYERLIGRLSLGPGQWLWLFKRSGQGQSQPRPTFWLGLAWLLASGQGQHSTRQGGCGGPAFKEPAASHCCCCNDNLMLTIVASGSAGVKSTSLRHNRVQSSRNPSCLDISAYIVHSL